MKSLSNLVDFLTKRVTCAELPRKKGLLLLRWTLFASLLGLGASSAQHLFDMIVVDVVLSIFLLINIALTMRPPSARGVLPKTPSASSSEELRAVAV